MECTDDSPLIPLGRTGGGRSRDGTSSAPTAVAGFLPAGKFAFTQAKGRAGERV